MKTPLFCEYTDDRIEKLGNTAFNKLVQREAARLFEGYNPNDHDWSATPTAPAPLCESRYEWKRYPVGQRHFGYFWAGWCKDKDNCKYHKDEILFASLALEAEVQ